MKYKKTMQLVSLRVRVMNESKRMNSEENELTEYLYEESEWTNYE